MGEKSQISSLLLVVALVLIAGDVLFQTPLAGPIPSDEMKTASDPHALLANAQYGQLPLVFIENQGQMDKRVAYYVQGSDKTLYFTPRGVTFALTSMADQQITPGLFALSPPSREGTSGDVAAAQRWVVKLDFVGANPNVNPLGQDPTQAVISYFKGSQNQWKTGLPTYAKLVYSDLWPGIDLVYSGTADRLKYEFLVKPGADPGQIRLSYRGAAAVSLNNAGQIEISTPVGSFQDDKPYGYQDLNGHRMNVEASYVLDRDASTYGFRVGEYDESQRLVLDPALLIYSGYFGGSAEEDGYSMALDEAGNAYITGATSSSQSTFPTAVGPDQSFNGAPFDAFVAKVNAAGTALIYAGYIGGNGEDQGGGIVVDSAGNAYIAGTTGSGQSTFPVTVGPDLTYNGNSWDLFVAKVNASGTALDYAGYIGGAGIDLAVYGGIDIDGNGNAYVTGYTNSSEATGFPVLVGPDLTYNGGIYDAFVAKVNAAGTGLNYAGFIGGNDNDTGYDIDVDSSGAAYVTGQTASSQSTFPVTIGPDLTFNGGFLDAYVAKVNPAGTALVFAGYVGGNGNEEPYGLAVDNSGNIYLTGHTYSTQSTFPVTLGPDLTFNGAADAFVVKVKFDGTMLMYAGYIGGSGDDFGRSIAADSAGNAYVTGYTNSGQATFPTREGPDLTFNGGPYDVFVARINGNGTTLAYAGYIGGSATDQSYGITTDSAGNAYVIGRTGSDQSSFPVLAGPDLTYNGGVFDTFVVKVATTIPAAPSPELAYVTNSWSDNVSVIDVATHSVIANILVGDNPVGLALTPEADLAYVPNLYTDNVSVIDTSTNTVITTIAVGQDPGWIAMTPDGAYIYVSNQGSDNVSVIDTATNTVVATVPTGDNPDGVAVTPNGDYVYVTNAFSDDLSVIDTATNTVVATVAVGHIPVRVEITPDGSAAYVANAYSHDVTVIDTATNTVVATVPVGINPAGLAFTPDGAYVYVTSGAQDTVSVIDTIAYTVIDTFPAGDAPGAIAIWPDGTLVYVANANADNVMVIDRANHQVLASIPVGDAPADIDFKFPPPPNSPPVADAGGPYNVEEGTLTTVNASGNDPEGGSLTYAWDLDNNGSFETPGQSVTFSAAGLDGPSNHIIIVQVTDDHGLVATDEATMNVLNVAPTAAFNITSSVAEGSSIDLFLTDAFDPSSADTTAGFAYAFDCGDGVGYGPFGSGNSASCPTTDSGSRTVGGRIRDKDGSETEYSVVVIVNNVAPTADFANASGDITEGQSATLTFTNEYDPSTADTAAGFLYSYDCTDDGTFELTDSAGASYSCAYSDSGNFTARGRIKDKDEGGTEYTAMVTVNNGAPAVSMITAPLDPVQVNMAVTTTAIFSDTGVLDTHTALWDWGDGNTSPGVVTEADGSGTVTGSHTYTAAGVYEVNLTVTDDDGDSGQPDEPFRYVVVYDPNAGFVTGNGTINSSAGSMPSNPSLMGIARFGFVSRYLPGANVPTGQTRFRFQVGDLDFESTSYEWLVVAGARAQYKGSGTINGIGNYGFLVTAIDGDVNGGGGTDRFRIKIWDKGTGDIIYDNQIGASDTADPTTAVQTGSIVIHR